MVDIAGDPNQVTIEVVGGSLVGQPKQVNINATEFEQLIIKDNCQWKEHYIKGDDGKFYCSHVEFIA